LRTGPSRTIFICRPDRCYGPGDSSDILAALLERTVPMNGNRESISVEIYGQTYNVRGEGDPAYLSELARFVDDRMREVAAQISSGDPVKIAILAALNMADDLHRLRSHQQSVVGIWMETTDKLAERLGEGLGDPVSDSDE
jgi:cell division protein ZapA